MSEDTQEDGLEPFLRALQRDQPPIPQAYVEGALELVERADRDHPESPFYVCAVHELMNARQLRDSAAHSAWIVETAEKLMATPERSKGDSCTSCVRGTQATSLVEQGRFREALDAFEAAFEAAERCGVKYWVWNVNAERTRKIAQCHLLLGDLDEARAALDRHLELRDRISTSAANHAKKFPDNTYYPKLIWRQERAHARNRTLRALVDRDLDAFDAEFEAYLVGSAEPETQAREIPERVDFVRVVQTALVQCEAWRVLVRHAPQMDRMFADRHQAWRRVGLKLDVARAQLALGDPHEARYELNQAEGMRWQLDRSEAWDDAFEALREAIRG